MSPGDIFGKVYRDDKFTTTNVYSRHYNIILMRTINCLFYARPKVTGILLVSNPVGRTRVVGINNDA